MYGSLFCRVYNEIGWNVYPEVLGAQLLEWLGKRGVRVARSLDLGCGTGVLCEALAAAGIETTGVDLSEGMIAIARERAPGLRYEVADMTAYRPEAPVDLVTCTGDALNHIFEPRDVARVFENVYGCLNRGGYFMFDLLNEGEVPPEEPFELDYSDRVRARFLTAREAGGIVNLNIAVYEDGALKLEEHIREKLHDPGIILETLRGAGFEIVQFDDRLLLDSDTHGTTWFVVARKS